jgi:AcrR family transcriptional regulator
MAFPAPPTMSPAPVLGPRAQRTRSRLIATTRSVFLAKGYEGTRIDDIADAAGTSRGSFYTYFPSKRDVLLAAGAETAREAERVIGRLGDIPTDWSPADIATWVNAWIAFLDVHASLVLVWGQAGCADDEFRVAGARTQMRLAKRLAETLIRLGHPGPVHATSDALALISMMERLWYYHHVAGGILDPDDMRRSILSTIVALLGGPPDALDQEAASDSAARPAGGGA